MFGSMEQGVEPVAAQAPHPEEHTLPEQATVSGPRQFGAVLRKNFLLQTRSRNVMCGLGGWAGLIVEILLPAAFFLLMCIPKYYIAPKDTPRLLLRANDLDSPSWAREYEGPAVYTNQARVLYAPNGTEEQGLMDHVAMSLACPEEAAKKSVWSTNFHHYFSAAPVPDACISRDSCLAEASCSQRLFPSNLQGFASEEAALKHIAEHTLTVDALVVINSLDNKQIRYTIRMNHTAVPSTRLRLQIFDLVPDQSYKDYWFFANLQQNLDAGILAWSCARRTSPGIANYSTAAGTRTYPVGGSPGYPADRGKSAPSVQVRFKPFPWPQKQIDLGAGVAGAFFNVLMVYAFLAPTRAVVTGIVREKELRLREGMRILGLQDSAYWGSWAITHFAVLAASGVLCAAIGKYPFRHTNMSLMLAFYWLNAAALIAFAYFLSTFFSKSRTAGSAAAGLYAVAMLPGYLLPSLQPYGGLFWALACLLPPSSIALFANVIFQQEVAARGVRWSNLRMPVTPDYPFSAATIFEMLIVDIALYALLTWYLDKVMPADVGSRRPLLFFLQPSYWKGSIPVSRKAGSLQQPTDGQSEVAVAIAGLSKVFHTTDGKKKRAVNDLTLDIRRDEITALLGPNGAGKTTTISMLTGVLPASEGDALVNGRSINTDMPAIRNNIGVCPQFDILWPNITVREHLELFAAIKGFKGPQASDAAVKGARDVGLEEKLDAPAEELSGGQRRKLSVAIAFVASPAVVFLDEPTSGMDPYSRRLTWDIIKRHRAGRAVVLTTHSMEEADLLADRIAILADGCLAAAGSSLDLKTRFGVGYTLTIVHSGRLGGRMSRPPLQASATAMARVASQSSMASSAEADYSSIEECIKRHVPSAQWLTCAGAELSYRLPRDSASQFPELLRSLQDQKEALGVQSYGLSVTTLEEVFLAVQSGAVSGINKPASDANLASKEVVVDAESGDAVTEADGMPPGMRKLQGWALYMQQLWALIVKRALCAKRDRLALLTQLAVPFALVVLAQLTASSHSSLPQEPALPLTRANCLNSGQLALGATTGVRQNVAGLLAVADGLHGAAVKDSGTTSIWDGPFFAPANGTLDGWLLDEWYSGQHFYDAIFLEKLANGAQVMQGDVQYTVMTNETAIHGLPAAISQLSTALLRTFAGANASIIAVNHPLPALRDEAIVKLSRLSGNLILVLFMVMASAVLSASFVVFLVRERQSQFKHVQVVSGAPLTAFWAATYLWDLLNYAIPAAGIVVCFLAFDLPQFRGPRLMAFIILLGLFGLASLPLTYLLHFIFKDEMKALQRLNTLYFLTGYLGFLVTWILDLLELFLHQSAVHNFNAVSQHFLRVLSPHYILGRCLFSIGRTYQQDAGLPNADPFTWDVTYSFYFWLLVQALAYMLATLVVEFDWLGRLYRWWTRRRRAYQALPREEARPEQQDQEPEDADVIQERHTLQTASQQEKEHLQVLLQGVSKSYGMGQERVTAVDDLWLGVPEGACFGLLGVNGAGKTTTFRMLTGELQPDAGDAIICGHSVGGSSESSRRLLGYCPQFNALPGPMTGREVLRMYARLRGVQLNEAAILADQLLRRLGLAQYADRACETYSGGTARKLSVAVALVGAPPVVLLDEPSTGMDPGARRSLWTILQKEVIDAGHTVVLTSHSMEECEALCTRIGILRAGHLRCLGTVQHLKNQYGAGYSFELRLVEERHIAGANDLVMAICRTAKVTQQPTIANGFRMAVTMPRNDFDLPELFSRVEEARSRLGIQEYAVSQTTLEHVFIRLARAGQTASVADHT